MSTFNCSQQICKYLLDVVNLTFIYIDHYVFEMKQSFISDIYGSSDNRLFRLLDHRPLYYLFRRCSTVDL